MDQNFQQNSAQSSSSGIPIDLRSRKSKIDLSNSSLHMISQKEDQRSTPVHTPQINILPKIETISDNAKMQPLQAGKIQNVQTQNLKTFQQTTPYSIPQKRNEIRKQIYVALSQKTGIQKSRFGLSKARFTKFVPQAFKLLATTAFIFVITLTALNYPAYSQILSDYLHPEVLQNAAENLFRVTKKPSFLASHIPLLPVAGIERFTSSELRSFDIPIISPDNRIIIPKIGKNIPIVDNVGIKSLLSDNWSQLEKDIQKGLEDGVIHYPSTAEPGNIGNFVITGHSSYYPWSAGKYKDVFALLGKLDVGDTYTVYFKQHRYDYEITERKIVAPQETSVLSQPKDKEISTLLTCYPVGTTESRLVLVAKPVK
ncbi:sortase [Candidatus Peregrinibacteria bacterium]|nr:sortase [Candidatus Peregrinibacteria bacterium]